MVSTVAKSILSELIQNADDAGARTVRIMLNTRQYGDGSLLGPNMSSWQGPSLYVYNDAAFTERDFQNLAKIGQVRLHSETDAASRSHGAGFTSFSLWRMVLPVLNSCPRVCREGALEATHEEWPEGWMEEVVK